MGEFFSATVRPNCGPREGPLYVQLLGRGVVQFDLRRCHPFLEAIALALVGSPGDFSRGRAVSLLGGNGTAPTRVLGFWQRSQRRPKRSPFLAMDITV